MTALRNILPVNYNFSSIDSVLYVQLMCLQPFLRNIFKSIPEPKHVYRLGLADNTYNVHISGAKNLINLLHSPNILPQEGKEKFEI